MRRCFSCPPKALSRGRQIHILSYPTNDLLVVVEGTQERSRLVVNLRLHLPENIRLSYEKHGEATDGTNTY